MAVRALARHPSRFQPCAAPTGLRAAVGAWARSTPAAARQLHCATPLRAGGGAKPSIVGCAWPQLRAESFFIIHARPARASPPPRAGRANSVPLGTVATLQYDGECGFNSPRAMWHIYEARGMRTRLSSSRQYGQQRVHRAKNLRNSKRALGYAQAVLGGLGHLLPVASHALVVRVGPDLASSSCPK